MEQPMELVPRGVVRRTREGSMVISTLLTASEAAAYLGICKDNPKNELQTLDYYRRGGHLRGVSIAGTVHYRLADLDTFIDRRVEP